MIINNVGLVVFSNESTFPSFDLTSDGIINFIPDDLDFVYIDADHSFDFVGIVKS